MNEGGIILIRLILILTFSILQIKGSQGHLSSNRYRGLITFNLTRNNFNYSNYLVKVQQKVRKRVLEKVEEVTIRNYNSILYTIKVKIGKKQQAFQLILDTGSSVLWIPSEKCSYNFTQKYKCTSEDDCFEGQDKLEINYAKGNAVGLIGALKLSIGTLPMIYQNFLLVSEVNDIPIEDNINGVIGLGLSEDKISSNWILQYYKIGVIQSPTFSIYISVGSNSTLTLGGYNQNFINKEKEIHYFLVNATSNRWMISVDKLSFGNLICGEGQSNSPLQAVVDSGFSLIGVNEQLFQKIQDYVTSELEGFSKYEQLFVQCSKINKLPTIDIQLANEFNQTQIFSLDPLFYLEEIQDGICRIPFTPFSINGISIILGDTFMRKYVTIFQLSPLKIGIVESINQPSYSMKNPSNFNFTLVPNFTFVIQLLALSIAIILSVFGITKLVRYLRAKRKQGDKYQENQIK